MKNDPRQSPEKSAKRSSVGIAIITAGTLLLIASLGTNAETQSGTIQTVSSSGRPPSGIANREWPRGVFPENIERSEERVRDAYVFASDPNNRLTMRSMKCYCGCDAGLDHKSIFYCYVEKLLPESKVVYSDHALNCLICQSEVWDAQKWQTEGNGPEEISRLIDLNYGGVGSTDTPHRSN